jgi:hypothetical protein
MTRIVVACFACVVASPVVTVSWQKTVDGNPLAAPLSSEQPITAVILLDATWITAIHMAPFIPAARTAAPTLGEVIEGARERSSPSDLYTWGIRDGVADDLRPGDRFMLSVIGRQVRTSTEFLADAESLMAAGKKLLSLEAAERYGPNPLWDATYDAAVRLKGETGTRAIIIVTAGYATGNRHGSEDAARMALDAGAAVHVVQQAPSFVGPGARWVDQTRNPWVQLRSLFGDEPGTLLRRIATATGGQVLVDSSQPRAVLDPSSGQYRTDHASSRARSLSRAFRRILASLRESSREVD